MKADFVNTTVEALYNKIIAHGESVLVTGNGHIDSEMKLTHNGEHITIKAVEGDSGPELQVQEWESAKDKY